MKIKHVWEWSFVPAEDPVEANGTAGDDTLVGRSGKADIIRGMGGNDIVKDWQGDFINVLNGEVISNDVFYGGSGSDKLICWSGFDTLDGGTGKDEFHFKANTDLGVGHIYTDRDDEEIWIENSDDGHSMSRYGNGDLKIEVELGGGDVQIIRVHGEGFDPRTNQIFWE